MGIGSLKAARYLQAWEACLSRGHPLLTLWKQVGGLCEIAWQVVGRLGNPEQDLSIV